MQTTFQKRTIKIQPKHVNRRWNKHKEVPQLRLQGEWFKEAGFEPGQMVDVVVKSGMLTIRPCTV